MKGKILRLNETNPNPMKRGYVAFETVHEFVEAGVPDDTNT